MGQVGSIAAASAGAGAIAAVLARKHGIKARVLEAHASIARGMRDGPDQELLRGTRGLRVAYLVVYPVKSCAGIRVSCAVLEREGLQHDRRFMVVNSEGGFLSQRSHPKMALIQPALELDGDGRVLRLTLSCHDMSSITISVLHAAAAEGEAREVSVWRSRIAGAIDQGDGAAEWLSRLLDTPGLRLVYLSETCCRRVEELSVDHERDRVSFADGFPLMIASQASLRRLNEELDTLVPMNRFRPNIVIEGGADAFEEDEWAEIDVAGVRLCGVKLTARCEIVTTDQQTAEQQGMAGEPIVTLKRLHPFGRGRALGGYFGVVRALCGYDGAHWGAALTLPPRRRTASPQTRARGGLCVARRSGVGTP